MTRRLTRSGRRSPSVWQPVREEGHLYERIVNRIEQVIHEEGLQEGDRLPPERELAQLLKVSRTSVREALKVLEARERLEVHHGLGIFVKTRRPKRQSPASRALQEYGLQELFAMRELLNVPAAGWAAESARPDELKALQKAWRAMEAAYKLPNPDYEQLGMMDANFHLLVTRMAGNRFLTRTMEAVHEMLAAAMPTTLSLPGRLEKSRIDHERIMRAIETGDATAARRAALQHVRGAQAAALARVAAQGDNQAPPDSRSTDRWKTGTSKSSPRPSNST